MAPMNSRPGIICVRLAAFVAAALLAFAFAPHLSHPSFAQGLPSEKDPGPPPDLEPGDGPPLEADTPETSPGKVPAGQTGLKVPRFASLRSGEVNVRTGPGTRYPVEWIFVKRGMPIEITAEFGVWRRVTDGQGGEGWVHRSMLSGKRAGIVSVKSATIRRRAETDASPVAKTEQGVIVDVRVCKDRWCEVQVQGFRGWMPEGSLWGVYPDEIIK
jgi:SH3-like domain-containing protein